MKRSISVAILFITVALNIDAETGYTNFNYADDNRATAVEWGTNKQESYDVAMHLNDLSLAGKSISRITIPVVESEAIQDYSIWLSNELKLESKVNAPDIATYACSPSDGWITVDLPETVTVPSDGLYVGYSFSMSSLDDKSRYPVVSTEFINRPGSFYVHTSRTYKQWKDVAQSLYMAPFISVRLEGDFPSDNLSVIQVKETHVPVGSDGYIPVKVRDAGGNPVEDIEYSVTFSDGDLLIGNTLVLDTPLEPSVLNSTLISLPVPRASTADVVPGSYAVDVKVDKVNGMPNTSADSALAGEFNLMPFIPVHKPVLEEYTGLWCGYCPRGFVGLEIMNYLYPDDFIGISYHGGDVMEVVPNDSFPCVIDGFPDAWIDRSEHTDAYSGRNSGVKFGVDVVWESARAVTAPADIRVEAAFIDPEQTTIYVGAYNVFAKKKTGVAYRQVFMLTADGLTDEKWFQTNNYSKDSSYDDSPWRSYWAPFVDGGGNVRGLVYNDVLVAYTDLKGEGFDIPEDYEIGSTVTMSHRFKVADIKNLAGDSFIKDYSKLNAVVLLVNAETGVIENANKVPVLPDVSSVHEIDANKVVMEEVYYDLAGRCLSEPTEGIMIRRILYTDGTFRTDKIVNRKR